MKLSKLFVLGAMGLVSLSASAYDYERSKPSLDVVEEVPVAFEVGKTYILYNTGAQMYFTQGSTWSTRGCVVPNKASAVLVRVAKYTLNDVWDGKTYEIENYVTNRSAYSWYKMCMNGAGDVYLDQTTWSRFVELKDQGSNVYRIMPNEVNNTVEGDNGGVVSDGTQFVGYAGLAWDGGGSQYDFGMDDNEERVPLSALTDQNVDWVFYSTAAYDAAMDVYNKAEELKAIINLAEEMGGIDTAAAEAVYENESSTLEQIIAAITALGEAIAAESGVEITGTAANPGDATEAITNPNFEGASYDGWLGTAPNMVGSGSHGPADVAEHYNKNFDTYQTLYGLPAGVYGLSASTFYRGSWDDYVNGTNRNAFLYATAGDNTQKSAFPNPWEAQNTSPMAGATEFDTNAAEATQEDNGVTYYIPNDPSAGRLYFEKGFYYNAVAFGVTNGSARIGVMKETAVTNDWSVFDTFGLKYYGNEGAASYASWLGDNASLLYANGAKASSQYVSTFLGVIESQKANATDATSANAAYITLKESAELAALKENIALWGQWEAALDDAQQYTEGDYSGLSSAWELGDYISEAEYLQELSNDQIKEEIEKIVKMVEAVKAEAKSALKENEDVTRFLTNPDFSNGTTGWTIENTGTSVGNTHVSQSCFEAWHNNGFDVYQVIPDVPVGIYEISVQGYVRYHDGSQAVTDWESGNVPENIPVYVYLNSSTTQFANVFENPMESGFFAEHSGSTYLTDSQGYEYPDNMTGAAAVFALDDETKNYTKKAYGLIANAGDELRIGVKGTPTDCWPIWDNFKLTYRGLNVSYIQPILEEAIQNIDTSKPMGKSVYAKVSTAINNANAALSSGNGETMFRALSAIFDLNEEINESVVIFAELAKAREDLVELMGKSQNEDAINEVGPFAENLENDINDHKYENEDVPGLLNQIKVYRTKLRLPADYAEASELNPIDMPIIDTPTFDNGEGGNSVEGWEAAGYNFGNDDTQKSALALEFYNKAFDLNQTIYGVPSGNYTLSVKAFARLDADKTNPVYLYAVTGNNEFKTEVKDLDSESGIGDMVSAAAAFEEGQYLNELPVTVGADGILRIGIKKETNNVSTTDWVIMDNWALSYLGAATSIKGDVNGDGSVDVADISAIISQMAGTATYTAADVNGDGSVDVADISNVITIMAEMARLAKNAIEE